MTYNDKVVLITGGCGGIGSYLTRKYLELGAKVMVFDIAPSNNSAADYYMVDLGNPEQIEAAFADIKAKYGAIHVLINNAAITSLCKPVMELTPDEFSRVIDVNLTGAFVCAREFVKANKGEPYGRIVNIASTRWHQNEAGWEAYGASKGGIVSLTNSLTVSLSDTPVTVNAISPGWIQTEAYETLSDADHAQHPSGRVGKPQDIVNACLFLTHAENDFVNGANIVVDGGMTKKMIYLD